MRKSMPTVSDTGTLEERHSDTGRDRDIQYTCEKTHTYMQRYKIQAEKHTNREIKYRQSYNHAYGQMNIHKAKKIHMNYKRELAERKFVHETETDRNCHSGLNMSP